MGLWPLEIFSLLQCGDRLYSSESEVYRRQILKTKVSPRAVKVKYQGLQMFDLQLNNMYNFHPPEFVGRVSETQFQLDENLNKLT